MTHTFCDAFIDEASMALYGAPEVYFKIATRPATTAGGNNKTCKANPDDIFVEYAQRAPPKDSVKVNDISLKLTAPRRLLLDYCNHAAGRGGEALANVIPTAQRRNDNDSDNNTDASSDEFSDENDCEHAESVSAESKNKNARSSVTTTTTTEVSRRRSRKSAPSKKHRRR